MRQVLLVLTNTRMSDKSIDTAIDVVKSKSNKLVILFVIDEEMSAGSVINKMTDEGWVGRKASEELYNNIENEYRAFGEQKIKEIERLATDNEIQHKTIIREGILFEEVLNTIYRENIELVLTTRRKRSSLSRFIFGSVAEDIKKFSKCEVMIIDE